MSFLSKGVQDLENLENYSNTKAITAALGKRVNVVKERVNFDRDEHFTFGDGDPLEAWKPKGQKLMRSIKWGQMKLLVSEIQFINLYWDPIKVPNPIIVYVGAALGTHTITLQRMYPQFEYHLYDPNKFHPLYETILDGITVNHIRKGEVYNRIDGETQANMTLHHDFFTDDDVKYWKDRNDVFFVVDMRASNYSAEGLNSREEEVQMKNEQLVWDNMIMQQKWCMEINPVKAHLKFRLPWTWHFVTAVGPTREYLDGLVYRQQWEGQTSTETRLVPHDNITMRNWNYRNYQDMCYYHNQYTRQETMFVNPFTNTIEPIDRSLGLLNDYDSIATVVIIQDYCIKCDIIPNKENVLAIFEQMDKHANDGKTNLIGLRRGEKNYVEQANPDEDNDE
jgi:hypothetical protein